MAPVAVGPADGEPEQATRARRRERMAASARLPQQGTPLQSGGRDTCHRTQPEKRARGHEMPPA